MKMEIKNLTTTSLKIHSKVILIPSLGRDFSQGKQKNVRTPKLFFIVLHFSADGFSIGIADSPLRKRSENESNSTRTQTYKIFNIGFIWFILYSTVNWNRQISFHRISDIGE
jgi:hypothetical protein